MIIKTLNVYFCLQMNAYFVFIVVVVPRPPSSTTVDCRCENVGFRSCIQGEGLCGIRKRSQRESGATVNRAEDIIFAWSIILPPNISAGLLNPV